MSLHAQKISCLLENHCTLKLPNLSRTPVITSDTNTKGKALYWAGGTRQHLLFAEREQSQWSSTGQEPRNTNVWWTVETSWIGSGHVRPRGQRQDLLSSHICFVWGFLKETRRSLEAVVRAWPLHNERPAETLPKRFSQSRSSTGYFSTENFFHLEESCCFCCLTSATPHN